MAKLTYRKRANLSSKEFAEPGKRKYPVQDKPHARNALARVSQFGTPEEKSIVRAKVHKKYPEIGESKPAGHPNLHWAKSKKPKEFKTDRGTFGMK